MPDDKAQRNFTDAESRIMPGPGGRDFQQAYNCQAVVDDAHQVIVAARATNQPSDKQQAAPMIEQAIVNAGAVPKEISADAGYYSAKAVDGLHLLGVDPFVAPDKTRHGNVPPPAPRGRIPASLSARDRMRRKLRTKRGRERYRVRKETVEPVFGQIKPGRGFRQFLLRGLAKVQRGVVSDLHRTQPAEAVPVRGRVKHQKAPRQRGQTNIRLPPSPDRRETPLPPPATLKHSRRWLLQLHSPSITHSSDGLLGLDTRGQ